MMAMSAMFAAAGTGTAATAITAPALLAATGPELLMGTAAAASGTAVAGATTGLAGALGFGEVMGGIFDTVSVIGDVLGTGSAIGQAYQTGEDRDLQALQMRNQHTLDEIRSLEELRANISASMVAAGASGLAPTGSVATGIEYATQQQEWETTVGGRDARIRAMQLEAEGESARGSTASLLFAGLGKAGSRIFSSSGRTDRRG